MRGRDLRYQVSPVCNPDTLQNSKPPKSTASHLSSLPSRTISGALAQTHIPRNPETLRLYWRGESYPGSHGVILRPPAVAEGRASCEYRSNTSGPAQAIGPYEQLNVPGSHTDTG